jgi:hypothetical protein
VQRTFRNGPRYGWETDYLAPLKNDVREINELLEKEDVGFPARVGLYYYVKHIEQ